MVINKRRINYTQIKRKEEINYNYNYNIDNFTEKEDEEINKIIQIFTKKEDEKEIKLYDLKKLLNFNKPPKPSICLSRDFIHDSLYNPHYGYFFNKVEILEKNKVEFKKQHDFSFLDQEEKLMILNQDDHHPSISSNHHHHFLNPSLDQRQIWSTPSELFNPWYAWSIAHEIVENYLTEKSQQGIHIIEIGAGNGTLCCGILDYIKQNHPKLYLKTNYITIELSKKLAQRQHQKVTESGHSNKVKVINQSILSLSSHNFTPILENCWILGMEVLDNLSRDVIRRDPITLRPFQSITITDFNGNFFERFIPITKSNNPNLVDYLNLNPKEKSNLNLKKLTEKLKELRLNLLPFQSNLTEYEFIPTNYLTLIKILFKFFPNHKIILSDFSHLNHSLNHFSSSIFNFKNLSHSSHPVVQTRFNGMTIPVSTFLVQQGLFDIFFPTDFDELIHIYKKVSLTKEPKDDKTNNKKFQLINQNQFLFNYLNSFDCNNDNHQIRPNFNPNLVLNYYQNAKILFVT